MYCPHTYLLVTVDVEKVPGWTIGSQQLRPCFTKVPVFFVIPTYELSQELFLYF